MFTNKKNRGYQLAEEGVHDMENASAIQTRKKSCSIKAFICCNIIFLLIGIFALFATFYILLDFKINQLKDFPQKLIYNTSQNVANAVGNFIIDNLFHNKAGNAI